MGFRERRLLKKAELARIKQIWHELPKSMRPKQYSNAYSHPWNLHEEIANSITHGIGALLGVAALIFLILDADWHHSIEGIVSGSIFGSTLIIAYLSSTIYHAVLYPPAKQFFKILDHSSIFLLIAGTYTPLCLITLHDKAGWILFWISWSLAGVGILLKCFFVDEFELVSTIIYLLMGWMALTVITQLIHDLSFWGCFWLAMGGLAYSLGVVFFILEKIPFFHTIWHLFVLVGSACHFLTIFFYVIPMKH